MDIFLVESVEGCQRYRRVFSKEGRFWNHSITLLSQFSAPSRHRLNVWLLLCDDSSSLMCELCVSDARSPHLMRQKWQTTERSFSKCLLPSHFHSPPVFSVMTCLCSTRFNQHKYVDWQTPTCGIIDMLSCFVSLRLTSYISIFLPLLSESTVPLSFTLLYLKVAVFILLGNCCFEGRARSARNTWRAGEALQVQRPSAFGSLQGWDGGEATGRTGHRELRLHPGERHDGKWLTNTINTFFMMEAASDI